MASGAEESWEKSEESGGTTSDALSTGMTTDFGQACTLASHPSRSVNSIASALDARLRINEARSRRSQAAGDSAGSAHSSAGSVMSSGWSDTPLAPRRHPHARRYPTSRGKTTMHWDTGLWIWQASALGDPQRCASMKRRSKKCRKRRHQADADRATPSPHHRHQLNSQVDHLEVGRQEKYTSSAGYVPVAAAAVGNDEDVGGVQHSAVHHRHPKHYSKTASGRALWDKSLL